MIELDKILEDILNLVHYLSSFHYVSLFLHLSREYSKQLYFLCSNYSTKGISFSIFFYFLDCETSLLEKN
jgi:hypothetical protein